MHANLLIPEFMKSNAVTRSVYKNIEAPQTVRVKARHKGRISDAGHPYLFCNETESLVRAVTFIRLSKDWVKGLPTSSVVTGRIPRDCKCGDVRLQTDQNHNNLSLGLFNK